MNSREVEERLRYILKRCDAFKHCKYHTEQDYCGGCCDAVQIAAKALEQADDQEDAKRRIGEWIPITERLPEDDRYILLSFANFSLPAVGRYEEDELGGAFYEGDSEKPCNTYGIYVDAWMELPTPYRGEAQE